MQRSLNIWYSVAMHVAGLVTSFSMSKTILEGLSVISPSNSSNLNQIGTLPLPGIKVEPVRYRLKSLERSSKILYITG